MSRSQLSHSYKTQLGSWKLETTSTLPTLAFHWLYVCVYVCSIKIVSLMNFNLRRSAVMKVEKRIEGPASQTERDEKFKFFSPQVCFIGSRCKTHRLSNSYQYFQNIHQQLICFGFVFSLYLPSTLLIHRVLQQCWWTLVDNEIFELFFFLFSFDQTKRSEIVNESQFFFQHFP